MEKKKTNIQTKTKFKNNQKGVRETVKRSSSVYTSLSHKRFEQTFMEPDFLSQLKQAD